MIRVVIYGNSGSGKSTLGRTYATIPGVHYLDLDEITWEASGVRKAIEQSRKELNAFIAAHREWVIEGCYGSLIEEATRVAGELIFLNPGVEECQRNCRHRPWEPHKYDSPESQDRNLDRLLDWIAEYDTRTDEYSRQVHEKIFADYPGKKLELKSNLETVNKAREIIAKLK